MDKIKKETLLVWAIVLCCLLMCFAGCSSMRPIKRYEYMFNITDDTITLYHNDHTIVGKVKVQGQLDSLLIDDNQ